MESMNSSKIDQIKGLKLWSSFIKFIAALEPSATNNVYFHINIGLYTVRIMAIDNKYYIFDKQTNRQTDKEKEHCLAWELNTFNGNQM